VHAILVEVTLWPIPYEGGDAVKSVKSTKLSVANKVLLGILGITGTVLVLLTTSQYGAGLSTDSVAYIATARNMAHGLGATSLDGNPLVLQAPFYSLLLACIDRLFGVDPLSSAPVVNALILGLLVYVSGSLISRHLTQGYVFALLGAAAVLLSPALFGVSVMAWSEPLFVLFVVLFLLCLESWLQDKGRAWFAILTLSAALACITRYAGVTLVLTGGLAILLLDRERWKARIVHAFSLNLSFGFHLQ
jgi:4-amino-4-deoxy-L-arabinose transferase-like glycosyltransferase